MEPFTAAILGGSMIGSSLLGKKSGVQAAPEAFRGASEMRKRLAKKAEPKALERITRVGEKYPGPLMRL